MLKKEQIVKKSLLVGVGLAAHAKDKSEKLAKELMRKGHIDSKEGKKLIKNIYCEAERSSKRVAKVVESELVRVAKLAKQSVLKKPAKKKTQRKVKKAAKKAVKKKSKKRKR